PASVDDAQLLPLAERLGISLPENWTKDQQRRLLQFAPQMLMAPGDERHQLVGGTRRGTVGHIRAAVRGLLGGLTGLDEKQLRDFPWVIEGFRERTQLRVGDRLNPPSGRTLWGPDSTGRLQLGDNSILGTRALLPARQSELDLYNSFAHRIRIVVPA